MQLLSIAESTLETELIDEIEDLQKLDQQDRVMQSKIDQAKQKLGSNE